MDSKILWIKADRQTIEMLRFVKIESDTPIDIEFMEFTPRNHMTIKNEIKQKCNRLKEFHTNWWTKVIPGERRNPNYQIEVSHVNCKKSLNVIMILTCQFPWTRLILMNLHPLRRQDINEGKHTRIQMK